MARCENNWILGLQENEMLTFNNARFAILYRCITNENCYVVVDNNISDSLSEFEYPYPSHCECCNCRRNGSIIAACNSSDSNESLSDEVTAAVDFSVSSNYDLSSVESFELERGLNSQSLFSDNEHELSIVSHPGDESSSSLEFSYLSSRYDDFNSQIQSEPEYDDNLESVDPGFSDAETQWPTDFAVVLPAESVDPSFSDAETQWPIDFAVALPADSVDPSFSDAETQWPTDFAVALPAESVEPSFSDAETQWPTEL